MKKGNIMNRRTAIAATVTGGMVFGLQEKSWTWQPQDEAPVATKSGGLQENGAEEEKKLQEEPGTGDLDRQSVMAAGMTVAEADCWRAIADAAGKFFGLPELHPMDNAEVANAIHIIQNKLLSRPTYRKYLEEAKKRRG